MHLRPFHLVGTSSSKGASKFQRAANVLQLFVSGKFLLSEPLAMMVTISAFGTNFWDYHFGSGVTGWISTPCSSSTIPPVESWHFTTSTSPPNRKSGMEVSISVDKHVRLRIISPNTLNIIIIHHHTTSFKTLKNNDGMVHIISYGTYTHIVPAFVRPCETCSP